MCLPPTSFSIESQRPKGLWEPTGAVAGLAAGMLALRADADDHESGSSSRHSTINVGAAQTTSPSREIGKILLP
jgi:hypothetical protein